MAIDFRATTPMPAPPRMTYEEFLEWADEDTWAEWVDGEVVFLSPVFDVHQDIAGFLMALFRIWSEARQSGIVRMAPFQMKTGPDLPGREPDVLYVANDRIGRMQKNYLDGPADLVVEIVSPESGTRDRREKFSEYERGGVAEYWLIDPQRQQAVFYQRDPAGAFQPIAADEKGIYHSHVLAGLWIETAWLWQRPLPDILAVLKAWNLI